jgi:hypothetical protein
MIAIKFVINNNVLPLAILISISCNQIQITHRGGSNATAIATPAKVSEKRLNPKEIIAISHDAKAIKRSTIVGDVLLAISCVICTKGTANVIRYATITHTSIVTTKTFNDLIYICLFPFVIANAKDCIGLKIGEISIAHITTGAELISNHSVAIAHDKTS